MSRNPVSFRFPIQISIQIPDSNIVPDFKIIFIPIPKSLSFRLRFRNHYPVPDSNPDSGSDSNRDVWYDHYYDWINTIIMCSDWIHCVSTNPVSFRFPIQISIQIIDSNIYPDSKITIIPIPISEPSRFRSRNHYPIPSSNLDFDSDSYRDLGYDRYYDWIVTIIMISD